MSWKLGGKVRAGEKMQGLLITEVTEKVRPSGKRGNSERCKDRPESGQAETLAEGHTDSQGTSNRNVTEAHSLLGDGVNTGC